MENVDAELTELLEAVIGGTELHVLEGKVEATPSEALAGTSPQLVSENQAVRFEVAKLAPVKFEGSRFNATLPTLPTPTRSAEVLWSFDTPGARQNSADQAHLITLQPRGSASDRLIPSPHGTALSFNGQNESAWSDFPGIGGSAPRTVSLWVRIPADARTDQPNGFIAWGRARETEKWQLATNCDIRAGNVGALRQEFGGGYIVGSSDLRDNRWHHIAVIFHGGDASDVTTHVKLYVDGRLETLTGRRQQRIATRTSTAPPDKDESFVFPVVLGRYIAQWKNRPVFFWQGALDEVRINDEVLTPAQVVALMEANRLP